MVANALHALPMSDYKWPLEIDAQQVLREYKEGSLTIKPITLDNTTITLYPHKQHCKGIYYYCFFWYFSTIDLIYT